MFRCKFSPSQLSVSKKVGLLLWACINMFHYSGISLMLCAQLHLHAHRSVTEVVHNCLLYSCAIHEMTEKGTHENILRSRSYSAAACVMLPWYIFFLWYVQLWPHAMSVWFPLNFSSSVTVHYVSSHLAWDEFSCFMLGRMIISGFLLCSVSSLILRACHLICMLSFMACWILVVSNLNLPILYGWSASWCLYHPSVVSIARMDLCFANCS